MIEFFLSGLYGTMTFWFQRNKSLSAQEFVSMITPMIKNMLSVAVQEELSEQNPSFAKQMGIICPVRT